MVGQQVHMSGLKGLPLTHVRIMNDKTVMKYWCVHLSELVCSSTDLNVSLIDTSLNEYNCSIYAKLLFKFIVLFKIVCTINFYSTSYSSDPATVLFFIFPFLFVGSLVVGETKNVGRWFKVIRCKILLGTHHIYR
jgi:hypothetical protein